MSVVAVVVTYNRRDLLMRCLEAVRFQADSVVVVDNGSTDGTLELLRDRADVRSLRLERNAGSAGGYAAGVTEARSLDADWIWLLDDDAEPESDTLARLLASPAAADPSTAVLCPAVVGPDGAVDLGHRGHLRGLPRARPLPPEAYVAGEAPALDYFTFVGPLVRMEVARAVDPPKAELFIWADDYEYSYRVGEHGAVRLVPEARIVHHDVGQAHTNRRSRFWNRLLGWRFVPTPLEGFWRNLCGVRNFVWIKKTYEGQGAAGAAWTTAQFMLKALLYDERPLRRLPWIVRYARAGRRGDFRNPDPAAWKAAPGGRTFRG